MLCIRSSVLIYLLVAALYLLTTISPVSPATTILFFVSMNLTFLDSKDKEYHSVPYSICLSLSDSPTYHEVL